MRNAYKNLDRNLKERSVCRWKVAVKIDFKGMIQEGLNWLRIHSLDGHI
jgi:hypothetical protein